MNNMVVQGKRPDGFKNLSINNFSKNGAVIPVIPVKDIEYDVMLTFVNAKVSNGKYTFLFMNSISSRDISKNNIRASQMDMKKLQSKIMGKVEQKDLKYIKLKEFSTSRVVFVFDIDSWLDDALRNVTGRVYLSKYDKEFKLRIQPPAMVRYYGIRIEFSRYVANYFKEYAKKKPQQRNVLFNIIPKSYENVVRTHVSNMFDYEYDFQSNRIIVRLKTIFLTGLIYASFALTDKKLNSRQKFEDMVNKNLSTFSAGKIKKIIPNKFF